jgi:hypothetical protein
LDLDSFPLSIKEIILLNLGFYSIYYIIKSFTPPSKEKGMPFSLLGGVKDGTFFFNFFNQAGRHQLASSWSG